MPNVIVLPNINGLAPLLEEALARRKLRVSDLNDDFLSAEAYRSLQEYINKLRGNQAGTLAVLIAKKAAELRKRDLELSAINCEATASNAGTQIPLKAKTLGEHIAEGGKVSDFGGNGWADESLPAAVADLVALCPQVKVIGPLESLAMAQTLASARLQTSPDITAVIAFVRTDGNHWQLSHTERTATGFNTTIHNPIGDGACGHRAAAKCLSILTEKYDANFGIRLVDWEAPKPAVEALAVAIYRQVNLFFTEPTPAEATAAAQVVQPEDAAEEAVDEPALPPSVNPHVEPAVRELATHPAEETQDASDSDESDEGSAQETDLPEIVVKIAEQEYREHHRSTSAMLARLSLNDIIESQQKELDYWARVKADQAVAESLAAAKTCRQEVSPGRIKTPRLVM